MLLRNVGVISFISVCAVAGIYFAQRDTVARGRVLAADLMATNPNVKAMTCDERIPIAVEGAVFHCGVEFRDGKIARLRFVYGRSGSITAQQAPDEPRIKQTSDPWGD